MIPRERHGNPFEDQSTAKKGMGDRDSGGDNNTDDKVRGADDNEHGTSEKLKRKDYEKELERLHGELVKLQEWVRHEGKKICIVFEGRDGAGKGGVIKAITARVSPRIFRVVALPAPTEREKSQMYIQRYLPHLPAGGEIVIFDRSWYNRAGVERIIGSARRSRRNIFSTWSQGLKRLSSIRTLRCSSIGSK